MKKTKKLLAGVAVSGVMLLSGISVFAAGSNNQKVGTQPNKTAQRTNYIDADADGICDNIGIGGAQPQDGTGLKKGNGNTAANTAQGINYIDTDSDGICDNASTTQGSNYIDADGDGVCDNVGTGGAQPQDGTGLKKGNGNAAANTAQGVNYIDADNDGICDNVGTGGTRPQNGSGRQNGKRR